MWVLDSPHFQIESTLIKKEEKSSRHNNRTCVLSMYCYLTCSLHTTLLPVTQMDPPVSGKAKQCEAEMTQRRLTREAPQLCRNSSMEKGVVGRRGNISSSIVRKLNIVQDGGYCSQKARFFFLRNLSHKLSEHCNNFSHGLCKRGCFLQPYSAPHIFKTSTSNRLASPFLTHLSTFTVFFLFFKFKCVLTALSSVALQHEVHGSHPRVVIPLKNCLFLILQLKS